MSVARRRSTNIPFIGRPSTHKTALITAAPRGTRSRITASTSSAPIGASTSMVIRDRTVPGAVATSTENVRSRSPRSTPSRFRE
jgi:hypothetical protein